MDTVTSKVCKNMKSIWNINYFSVPNYEHVYMRPEVNSSWFEILLRGKISLRCNVTSLFAFK